MDTLINCGEERLSLHIANSAKRYKKILILCFGGSKVRFKERYNNWQNVFTEKGINSISFDYSGTGKSTGNLSDSSLIKRINETACVINWLKNNYGENLSLNILGESMGAYIALGALNAFQEKIDKLILMVPAAFSPLAHSLPFDQRFTNEIRKNRSWESSLSFNWLSNFSGKALLLISKRDSVVPGEILEKYKNCISDKKSSQYYEVADAPHGIWGDYEGKEAIREIFLKKIISFIKK